MEIQFYFKLVLGLGTVMFNVYMHSSFMFETSKGYKHFLRFAHPTYGSLMSY